MSGLAAMKSSAINSYRAARPSEVIRMRPVLRDKKVTNVLPN
jgi:hypothetical protein